jgi:hypothetical protein
VRCCACRQWDDDRAAFGGGEKVCEELDAVVREDSVSLANLNAGGSDRVRRRLGAKIELAIRQSCAALDIDERDFVRRDARAFG